VKRFWRRDRSLFELEDQLRARRSEPPASFVRLLSERARPDARLRHARLPRPRARVALAAGVVGLALVAAASTGGLSLAASSITSAVRTVAHIAQSPSQRVNVTSSPALTQYGVQCGSAPRRPCIVKLQPSVRYVHNGPNSVSFSVSLNLPSDGTVSVKWSTLNGTAKAPIDYQAVPPTLLTFTAGQQTKTITINLTPDPTTEANENFLVRLSQPAHAIIVNGLSTVWILP
jgi:hypothetical protein